MILQTAGDEKVRGLDRVLLSLGIACARFIGGLTYVFKNGTSWTPVNDSTYLALRGAPKGPHRIVVLIDHDPRGFNYTINSERVQDPLLKLSKLKEWREAEVILLVHDKVTLAMVNNMIGILSKAGHVAPPRVFVFDSNKNAMNELNFTYAVTGKVVFHSVW
jgi:hypothetical protein